MVWEAFCMVRILSTWDDSRDCIGTHTNMVQIAQMCYRTRYYLPITRILAVEPIDSGENFGLSSRTCVLRSQNHSLSIPYPVLVPVLVGSGANFGPGTRYPVSWYPYSIGAGVTCVGRVRFSAQILVPV